MLPPRYRVALAAKVSGFATDRTYGGVSASFMVLVTEAFTADQTIIVLV